MYRIAICDDEKIFVEHLKKMTQEILYQLGISYEITTFFKGIDLLNALKKRPQSFHLLMLDIMLDNINGVNLAKKLRNKGNEISILFITSTKEFSLDGYEVNPIHYLVKPVQKNHLSKIIEKEYKKKFLLNHIIVNSKYQKHAVSIPSIIYVERLNRKMIIHTKENNIEHIGTLKEFLPLLPESLFIRCHKSFIVNVSKIISISRFNLVLEDEIMIPVGRVYYKNSMSSIISCLEQR